VKGYPGTVDVTLKISAEIPLRNWARNYFDKDGGVLASTYHYMLKRVPVWLVSANRKRIFCYLLCSGVVLDSLSSIFETNK
jgi:hypothetical protein